MMTSETDSTDPQQLEDQAAAVVDTIRAFVDILRGEFNPVQSPASSRELQKLLPLYTRAVERGLVAKVQENTLQPSSSASTTLSISSTNNTGTDERSLLVQQILLPLIQSLTLSYRALDSLPEVRPPPPPATSQGRRRRKPAPPPPRGMLSIQNYTDVACLLEFTVCTSILPALDPHVLVSIEDRIQYQLPKSLAGRIPRKSLAWATDSKSQFRKPCPQELLEVANRMGELVLLDRFRPMLLPRHVADLYAAIFQYEQCRGPLTTNNRIRQSLGISSQPIDNGQAEVDATIQAKAYQTLLLQGTKSPPWVRKRVSPLLTKLACSNLASIVQVFVPLQKSSMASQRLGRTLATSLTDSESLESIGRQIRLLLEILYSNMSGGELPGRAMAILQTIWALLTESPPKIFAQTLLIPWQSGLQAVTSSTDTSPHMVHRIIRQIGALCAFVPPFSDSLAILHHIFQPSKIHQLSIFDQLVRVASMSTVLASTAKADACQTLQWLSIAVYGSSTKSKSTWEGLSKISGCDLLLTAWVRGLSPLEWDLPGHSFKLQPNVPLEAETEKSKDLEVIGIEVMEAVGDIGMTTIADMVNQRIKVLSETLLDASETKASSNSNESSILSLPSTLFRLLLKIHLSSEASWSYRLVAILLLPVLHEKSSPEDLLFGSGEEGTKDATGLLKLIHLILSSVGTKWSEQLDAKTISDNNSSTGLGEHLDLQYFSILDAYHSPLRQQLNEEIGTNLGEDQETSLSIVSLVLSLLIAVLELGSMERTIDEESILRSFLPLLERLANLSTSHGGSDRSGREEIDAGISDMSGYAMALIGARAAPGIESTQAASEKTLSTKEKLLEIIQQSEADLQSTQPPLRARGVVSLGRLARGYLGILPINQKHNPKALVSVLHDASSSEGLIDLLIAEVLRLSVIALADKESYVFLGAVQTIVAMGDMRPAAVLPILGKSVVLGKIFLSAAQDTELDLSQEQRIKLAEALIFTIHRRAAPEEFVPMLINLMLFGNHQRIGALDSKAQLDDDTIARFAEETDKYFRSGVKDNQGGEYETSSELDIRVKTGGPIFQMEESDVVRSLPLSILAEVVSVAQPAVLAKHCHTLVDVIYNVLTLDPSRCVCRAASLLARELYAALLREYEYFSSNSDDSASLMLAVALFTSNEAGLVHTLARAAANAGNSTVNDPTTSIRCKEALDLRNQSEEVGIFAAAEVILNNRKQNLGLPSILTSAASPRSEPRLKIDAISNA